MIAHKKNEKVFFKLLLIIGVILIFVVTSFTVMEWSGLQNFYEKDEGWSMIDHDAGRSNSLEHFKSSGGAPSAENLLWKYHFGTPGGDVVTDVRLAVGYGKVFVATSIPEPKLYAFDAYTGDILWTKDIGWPGTPIAAYGKVFIDVNLYEQERYIYRVYAVEESTGDIIWTKDIGDMIVRKMAVSNHKVFVPTREGTLLALDQSTGDTVWKYDTHEYLASTPCVGYGLVFVGTRGSLTDGQSYKGKLYALDENTGTVLWNHKCHGVWQITLAYEKVFISSFYTDSTLYVLSARSGEELWRFRGEHPGEFSQALVVDGVVYVYSHAVGVYALDKNTGKIIWYSEEFTQPPCAIADDRIFLGGGRLRILDRNTGNLIWKSNHDVGLSTIADGMLFCSSIEDIYVYGDYKTVKQPKVLISIITLIIGVGVIIAIKKKVTSSGSR